MKNMIHRQKDIVLDTSDCGKPTSRCRTPGVTYRGRPCDGCNMMGETPHVKVNTKVLRLDGGNCKSSCLIYVAICTHCSKCYFGKTIQALRDRISGHRSFMNIFDRKDEVSDENCLAAHVITQHNVNDSPGFNLSYKFSVVEHVSAPKLLLTKEQLYINSFRTFRPFGLNTDNPIGLKAQLVSGS